jgi:hypothetical protein
MKRFQSMIFASLLTLAISATALAGDIHGIVGDPAPSLLGDIHGIFESIILFVAQAL